VKRKEKKKAKKASGEKPQMGVAMAVGKTRKGITLSISHLQH
jgi:hypothetical protein